jgi:hypothetical protein
MDDASFNENRWKGLLPAQIELGVRARFPERHSTRNDTCPVVARRERSDRLPVLSQRREPRSGQRQESDPHLLTGDCFADARSDGYVIFTLNRY